jgi:hypothetical protein
MVDDAAARKKSRSNRVKTMTIPYSPRETARVLVNRWTCSSVPVLTEESQKKAS